MAREVNNIQPFQDKVVKLIPTEIVGAYLVILGIIAPASETGSSGRIKEYLLVGVFFFLLVLTPIYLWHAGGVRHKGQLAVSTISYVIWIYTLVYPFLYWGWHDPMVGAVILVLWSMITPFFINADPKQPTLPTPLPEATV